MVKARHSSDQNWPRPVGDYDYVLTLSEPELAWEFLRRNPDYRRDYHECGTPFAKPRHLPSGAWLWRRHDQETGARRWGLAIFRRSRVAGTRCSCLLAARDRSRSTRRTLA